jgi:hypothetical protein
MPINPALKNEWIAAGYKSDMGSAIACSPPAHPSAIRLAAATETLETGSFSGSSRREYEDFKDLIQRKTELLGEGLGIPSGIGGNAIVLLYGTPLYQHVFWHLIKSQPDSDRANLAQENIRKASRGALTN